MPSGPSRAAVGHPQAGGGAPAEQAFARGAGADPRLPLQLFLVGLGRAAQAAGSHRLCAGGAGECGLSPAGDGAALQRHLSGGADGATAVQGVQPAGLLLRVADGNDCAFDWRHLHVRLSAVRCGTGQRRRRRPMARRPSLAAGFRLRLRDHRGPRGAMPWRHAAATGAGARTSCGPHRLYGVQARDPQAQPDPRRPNALHPQRAPLPPLPVARLEHGAGPGGRHQAADPAAPARRPHLSRRG
mmetsp:Transcript_24300/g.76236  ORF Transcript_24300/g.76236 Transcript_24300/m.76236 type:complete len:243 (-) Transcript_24300:1058-1786(-)